MERKELVRTIAAMSDRELAGLLDEARRDETNIYAAKAAAVQALQDHVRGASYDA